jgi:hypothetical protein
MKSGVRAQGSAVYDRGFAGVARGMDGGVSLQIQGLKPLAKITRSHWDRDRKRPKAAVVNKHLVLFKSRLRGKKQAEWLLHDLAQMGHGFRRSELQAVYDRGFAGIAYGKYGGAFPSDPGVETPG